MSNCEHMGRKTSVCEQQEGGGVFRVWEQLNFPWGVTVATVGANKSQSSGYFCIYMYIRPILDQELLWAYLGHR